MDKAILRAEADHGLAFEVTMLPFQLDPALPSASIDKVARLAHPNDAAGRRPRCPAARDGDDDTLPLTLRLTP